LIAPGVQRSICVAVSQSAVLVALKNETGPLTPGAVETVSVCGSVEILGKNVRLEGLTARPPVVTPEGAITSVTLAQAASRIGPTYAAICAVCVPSARFEGSAETFSVAGPVPLAGVTVNQPAEGVV
jgi:hypothetical protein